MKRITVETSRRTEFVEITDRVRDAVRESGARSGVAVVYVPHTTAGCTINENADPDVKHDMLAILDRVIPFDDPEYRHAEGNSAAHIKASMMGASQHILVEDGEPLLGRWQGVYLCEFDGPRSRQVWITVSPGG